MLRHWAMVLLLQPALLLAQSSSPESFRIGRFDGDSWTVTDVQPVSESEAQVRFINIYPACGTYHVNEDEQVLEAPVQKLAGSAALCIPEKELARKIALQHRKTRPSGSDGAQIISARCGSDVLVHRLPSSETSNAEAPQEASARTAALFTLADDIRARYKKETGYDPFECRHDCVAERLQKRAAREQAAIDISSGEYDLVFPDIPLAMQKDGQAKLSLAMPSPEEATRPEMDFGEIENAAELGFEKVEDVAYPQMARIAHIEGDVRIDLGIDVPSGKVVSTTPVSGHPLLQRAVADAATQWAFSHPYFGPNPLPVMVHFKLRCPLIVETSQSVIAASKKNKPRSHNEWPPIRPVEVSRTLNNKTTIADTPFFLSIKDVHRVTIYRLECHNGNYENGSKINFSGDFQCALFAIKNGSRVSGNLLATNTKDELSTEWWNRGRMRSAQLRGKCLDYPDYSTDRIFKLRGMRLTLRFTKMKWGRNKSREHGPVLTGFTFTFKAVPDESAHTANADVVGAPAPPASCYP